MEQGIILKPEVIGHLGPLPLTNTLLVSWLVMLVIIGLSLVATRKVALVPSGIQNFFEMILEFGYNTVEELAQSRTKFIYPFVMTFFLFIFFANLIGLLPGFGTIYLKESGEKIPVFRSLNSDLNMTLALALVSAVVTHIFAIKTIGIKDYLKKWFSFNPIFLFVGLLELVSEFTKVVSLSFRLFGNIFAGEVVLNTVSKLAPWTAFIVPVPFYLLEVIVAFVQAAVFMMLTLVFMVLLSEKHESH